VKQGEAELGPVDVLVNNAGHGGTAARLADGDVGPLRAVLAVNVVAPAVLCSLVLPGMVARGSGHALNITSLQGSWTFPGYTAYGEQWTPAERVAEKAAALVSGRYDVLTGRFVHAEDDLDALVASLPADDGDARRLRLTAVPGGDPVLG
jgi:hypothetical protein